MRVFVFGLGYTARHFVRDHARDFTAITGTVRSEDKMAQHDAPHVEVLRFAADFADSAIASRLATSDVALVSVQPGLGTDPVLAGFQHVIASSDGLRSIVYLSTIGVYGDHGGAWIDESAATEAANPRQVARIDAERAWIELGRSTGKAVTILRLAGIYGPGRNALDDLRAGDARRIDKPGQVFNRIHVADIGRAVAAAFQPAMRPSVFNVTDDEPAPASDVVAYAARLMGREPPPLVPFAEANLSPMARSFYGANRRVSNRALKDTLGVTLAYPTYRKGLDALWEAASRG